MLILALDPAEYRVGWALGEAGAKPAISVFELRRGKDERTEEAVGRFGAWLYDKLQGVDLCVAEQYIPAGALEGRTTSQTRDGAILLNGAIRGICGALKIPVRCLPPATIRKHFCGQAHAGSRDETKRMVTKQARLLGYIPPACTDEDMGDAAAIFDFASSHFGRRAAAFQLTERA